MRNIKHILILLALSFTVLMSLPFLVPHLSFLALFGIVPLLLMEEVADAHGVRRFFWWHYLTFVLWNAVTTFWVCNATIGGGVFAVLANAIQMSLIFGVYRCSKRHFRPTLSLVFLAVLWIAWERHYLTGAQISWPWLVLGNAFARDVASVQWYEYTGTLGGSVWVWAVNITLFLLMKSFMQGTFGQKGIRAAAAALVWTVTVILAPYICSWTIWHNYEEDESSQMQVVIAQPDFDPYEKFQALTQAQQDAILIDLFDQGMKQVDAESPVLLIAPETFTSDVVLGRVEEGYTWNYFMGWLESHPNANILFGASTRGLFETEEAPSVNAYHLRDGRWLENHNSAIMMDRTGRTEIFHKSKLVVGVEMTPYPRFFTKIDDLLGNVMGRNVGQDRVTVLNAVTYDRNGSMTDSVPVGSIVCYESIYGEYCTEYVRAGAQVLSVITNDAWWGDTPGYRQHLSYSSLRAIETRRDIARCANTGISAFIDQKGRIHNPSSWWEKECLTGKVNLNDSKTFFVTHGDMAGRVCTFAALMLLLLLLIRFIIAGRSQEQV